MVNASLFGFHGTSSIKSHENHGYLRGKELLACVERAKIDSRIFRQRQRSNLWGWGAVFALLFKA
ncbi:MAG: hypothetical protein NW214_08590 [Pseudanabaenaceae cyanobacterium bins.39]|nr:hypothetical protein [Pseudanabaenaceae cyanobacterium bins.39]